MHTSNNAAVDKLIPLVLPLGSDCGHKCTHICVLLCVCADVDVAKQQLSSGHLSDTFSAKNTKFQHQDSTSAEDKQDDEQEDFVDEDDELSIASITDDEDEDPVSSRWASASISRTA